MNFAGNFIEIGRTDIRELENLVCQLSPAEWNADSTRQRRYEAHRDTQTVGLVYDEDFRHAHPTKRPRLRTFEPAMRPALALITDYYEQSAVGKRLCARNGLGYFVRASLIRLQPGGNIAPHQDNNFSLAHSHRIHVPVLTSREVVFTVGGESISLPAGGIFEINNRRIHSVSNAGSDARVHLVLDFVLPGEPCCCSAKTHPDVPCSPSACVETDRMIVPCTCYPETFEDDTSEREPA